MIVFVIDELFSTCFQIVEKSIATVNGRCAMNCEAVDVLKQFALDLVTSTYLGQVVNHSKTLLSPCVLDPRGDRFFTDFFAVPRSERTSRAND